MEMEQLKMHAMSHWRRIQSWQRDEAERWIYCHGVFFGMFLSESEHWDVESAAEFLSDIALQRYFMAIEEQEANQEQKNDS